MQLLHRRTGLQRNSDGSDQRQCHVNDRVVRTGEAQSCHPVAGLDRVVGQGIREGPDASPGLAVGQGVEAGQQLGNGASVRIGDEFNSPLAESRAVGIAVHHGSDHVGE